MTRASVNGLSYHYLGEKKTCSHPTSTDLYSLQYDYAYACKCCLVSHEVVNSLTRILFSPTTLAEYGMESSLIILFKTSRRGEEPACFLRNLHCQTVPYDCVTLIYDRTSTT